MTQPPASRIPGTEPDALGKVLAAGLHRTSDIARAAGVTRRTVQRWLAQGQSRRPPAPGSETRLLELAAVLEQASLRLPGGNAAAALWLRAPSQKLGWQAPLDVISRGGFRQVIAALPAPGSQASPAEPGPAD